MKEYVFRPSRIVDGKRVFARSYTGGYTLARGEKVRRVALHTPSKRVAEKMLRELIIEKQSEREGLIPASAMREAAVTPILSLLSQYRLDLFGRGLNPEHVKATGSRIERIASALQWRLLSDVRPDKFVAWRAGMVCSAKTKKEFQTSANAFFNWLVRMGKLSANPLSKVDRVDIRGKAVRKSRAFSQGELSALVAGAPENRRIVYLFLAYTGARKNEAAALRWSDVQLGKSPSALFRGENTKSKEKRPVPLKAELALELRALADVYGTRCAELGVNSDGNALVFSPFPSDDALHADMRRAGIERKDATGRVLHFHAFRKTFQTWGAVAGIGQRSAQEMLGHSDPSLTAGVYTDVAALELHTEVAKLPWVGSEKECADCAPKGVKTGALSRFHGLLAELAQLAKGVVSEGETNEKRETSLAARHGFEPLRLAA